MAESRKHLFKPGDGLPPGTLSNAKAHLRRAGTVSEGFRRYAPTSLDDREQCITRCDYVALCLPSYPYVSQLTTDTPSNTNAALTCGTCNALYSAVSEGFEPPVRCRTPVFEAGSFNHSDNSPVSIKKGMTERISRHALGLDDWT